MKRGTIAVAILGALFGAWLFWPDPVDPIAGIEPEDRAEDDGLPVPLAYQSTPLSRANDASSPPVTLPTLILPDGHSEIADNLSDLLGEAVEVALLDVFVRTDRGDAVPDAFLMGRGCWLRGMTDSTGHATLTLQSGQCDVRASRLDGMLAARSKWVQLDLQPGERAEVELVLPSERTGGLGVQFWQHDEGMIVLKVIPGAPAWDMGLEEGDLIVEVDGLPTAALTTDEFVQVLTGPEGTGVEFVVAYKGDTGLTEDVLQLERTFIGGSNRHW